MELITHGGKCCGIKTIEGFAGVVSGGPNATAQALEAIEMVTAEWIYPAKRFFHHSAPKETQLERLDRYLAFLDKYRTNGVCEAVIANYKGSDNPHDQMLWRPVLEERGFKEVSNCHNSNSGNRIYIFHRVRDKEEKKAA